MKRVITGETMIGSNGSDRTHRRAGATVDRMRTWSLAASVLMLAAMVLAACSGGTPSGPPEINYGRDVCDQCHMIISEARFAAAYRDADGKPFVFDDIGDMLTHLDASGDPDGVTAWVHDYETEEWIEVGDAWLVHSEEIETPMGGGVIALANRDDAERYAAANDTEVLQWQYLLDNIDEFSIHEGHGMHEDGGPDAGTTDDTTDDGDHG